MLLMNINYKEHELLTEFISFLGVNEFIEDDKRDVDLFINIYEKNEQAKKICSLISKPSLPIFFNCRKIS